jgi:hypothetical protein
VGIYLRRGVASRGVRGRRRRGLVGLERVGARGARADGFVATIVAATDPRIVGVVLVDANLAGFFDDAQTKRLLATYRPQFPALEQAAPELARVMIPVIEALPCNGRAAQAGRYPSRDADHRHHRGAHVGRDA